MGPLQYAVCGECGLVYQAPHPSRSYLRSYYQGGYHLHMHGQSDPSAKTEWAESKRAESLVAFARPYLSSVRNHLDVGSSLGKLLAGFKDVFACQSHGVEPAVVFRQNARALGVDVVGSLADLDPGQAHSYDLVSLSHVLEHMTDPVGTLRLFHQEWMSEDGASVGGSAQPLRSPLLGVRPSLRLHEGESGGSTAPGRILSPGCRDSWTPALEAATLLRARVGQARGEHEGTAG